MKVLLAVDGSDFTKRMLAYVAAHDELIGPQHEFVAVTVVGAIPPHAARHLESDTLKAYYHDKAQEVLQPIVVFAQRHGWKLRAVQAIGSAAEEIANCATHERVGLIVVGSHGHSALSSVVLGSVATGILARCKVPVLVVR